MLNTINGMKIIFSDAAMRESLERNFPISRHRSKRITKKLIKRFGSEYRKVPCMYIAMGVIYAHPSMKEELIRGIERENERQVARPQESTLPMSALQFYKSAIPRESIFSTSWSS